jgi:hypothetical protein
MDPFVEARGLWADFHDNLIVEIQRRLNSLLPERYEALLGQRTYVDIVEPGSEAQPQALFQPDIRIDQSPGTYAGAWREPATGSNASTAVLMHPALALEERESYLEIRDSGAGDRVVTCLEILSPANKRPGSPGWAEYERKRQAMFAGAASFVEIDLLRGGRRRPMRERWPDSPYYVLVMRQSEAPLCRVWPAFATRLLPDFAIPLAAPDADLVFGLQAAVTAVLAQSRYERRLRYHEAIEPPLTSDEAAMLPIPR